MTEFWLPCQFRNCSWRDVFAHSHPHIHTPTYRHTQVCGITKQARNLKMKQVELVSAGAVLTRVLQIRRLADDGLGVGGGCWENTVVRCCGIRKESPRAATLKS